LQDARNRRPCCTGENNQVRNSRRGPSRFVPDVTFKGSSLSGWRVLGQAEWRATNGEIVGTPKPGAG